MDGITATLARFGTRQGPEVQVAVKEFYRPLVKRQPNDGITITNDIAYGADERHRLDVYQPAGEPAGRHSPVVIVIPGAGFIRGEKNGYDGFYANVGTYFARQGMPTIVANYRLAPKHPWPAGAQDVGLIVGWARALAPRFGGDPDSVYVVGHSAGATHVATYLFDKTFHSPTGNDVKGGLLVSGRYRIAGGDLPDNIKAYFGDNADEYEHRSPMMHVQHDTTPLLIAAAEYDPPALAAQAFDLASMVTLRDGRSPTVAWLRGHNHLSSMHSIGSGREDVGELFTNFIRDRQAAAETQVS
jgi:acetyl esterase/lipase